ncbi:MAG TPA: hypothetical protein VMW21_02720 [Patescibacteria group bacterium]|nr:hypothetical protein [Patescibacteria group bacterium]
MELDNLFKKSGQVRGVVFNTDAEYILGKKGEEGLKKVEEKTKEWGRPIEYKKIRNMEWYPVGLRVVSLLAVQEAFGWQNNEIEDMGYSAPSHSFIVKLLMKYFLTLKQTYERSPSYWTKHYDVGELKVPEYNEEKKHLVLHLSNFEIHPILCLYYLGYFRKIAELGAQQKIIGIEETRCSFKGDSYHEYVIKWK